MISSSGKVVTANLIGKNFDNSSERPFWLILHCHSSIANFYLNQIKRNTNLSVSPPLAGSHISIVRKEKVIFPKKWKKSLHLTLSFKYQPKVETNGKHWWLPVVSTDAEDLRESLGLSRTPYVPFHLTVATHNDVTLREKKAFPNSLKNRYSTLLKMKEILPSVIWETAPEKEELHLMYERFHINEKMD